MIQNIKSQLLYICVLLSLGILWTPSAWAQNYRVSGIIIDSQTKETLIGTNIYVPTLKKGVISDTQGKYSITLPRGKHKLKITYIGYKSWYTTLILNKDTTLNIKLESNTAELQQVEISAEGRDHNVSRNQMSTVKLKARTIEQIPALMGEVDIIKAVQLLPGVTATSEGSSTFNVRGGSSDQNLILLDEATVYNASHLMGFFSVFNNEAVRDVKLYKGDIPLQYGGRLSSLLDVRMQQGNKERIRWKGGIGTISSRLSAEGPIGKKTQFLLTARRSYADLFLPLAKEKEVRDNTLHFYDLNGTLYHKINENNSLSLSLYNGQDLFANKFSSFYFGNTGISLNWKKIFNDKLAANISAIYSRYNYGVEVTEEILNEFKWTSELQDIGSRIGFSYFHSPKLSVYWGGEINYHIFKPGTTSGTEDKGIDWDAYSLPKAYAMEEAIYLSVEQKLGHRWQLRYGLRGSAFHNIGPGTVYGYDENYEATDSTTYNAHDFYNTYLGLEPRFNLTYSIDSASSIKTAYARTIQYMQLSQNSTSGTPLDIWFPSSPQVKPQVADQVSVGYFRNFDDNRFEGSIELYYKYMHNSIGFKDYAQVFLNKQLEGELRFGHAEAYGLEFMMRKNYGKWQGWLSYTYSRVWKKLEGVNKDKRFPALYDKPHTASIILNYKWTPRLSLGLNWVYATGQPATFPVGKATIEGQHIPVYSDRNSRRFKDYHRMDIAITWYSKPGNKRYKWNWNFSVYNLYSRHNTWAINFVTNEDGNTYAEQTYLFPIVPSITFNFNF